MRDDLAPFEVLVVLTASCGYCHQPVSLLAQKVPAGDHLPEWRAGEGLLIGWNQLNGVLVCPRVDCRAAASRVLTPPDLTATANETTPIMRRLRE